MKESERPDQPDHDDGPVELDEPVETLSMKNSFGTAVGAAMLGFEQALRNDPPPEVMAAEHIPERGQAGDGTDIVIEFPDDEPAAPAKPVEPPGPR